MSARGYLHRNPLFQQEFAGWSGWGGGLEWECMSEKQGLALCAATMHLLRS